MGAPSKYLARNQVVRSDDTRAVYDTSGQVSICFGAVFLLN